jgi:hypothetical protein
MNKNSFILFSFIQLILILISITKSKSKSIIIINTKNENEFLTKNFKKLNNDNNNNNKEKIEKFLELESKIELEINKEKDNFLLSSNSNKNLNLNNFILEEIDIIHKFNSSIRNLEYQRISKYDPLYGQAQNINCSEKNCKAPNVCLYGNTYCNCSIEFANFFEESKLNNKTEKIYCSYERKGQLTAFIISIFFNFGLAQFYIGTQNIGFIKLGISMIAILLLPFAICYKKVLLSMLIGLFVCFIITIWGLIDIILFGINYYNDGNEVPLKPW